MLISEKMHAELRTGGEIMPTDTYRPYRPSRDWWLWLPIPVVILAFAAGFFAFWKILSPAPAGHHRTPPAVLTDCPALLEQARTHLQKSIDSRWVSDSTAGA